MLASDVADLYVGLREGESFAAVATSFERRLKLLGWNGHVRKGPPPPAALPSLPGSHAALVFDLPPSAEHFADAVREVQGQGRHGFIASVDANLVRWRWVATDRDFPERGLTLHFLFDTSARMAGSLFALVPGIPPTFLYFGATDRFAELIRAQVAVYRGAALIFERIEFDRKDGPAKGAPLRGSIPREEAPVGAVIIVIAGTDGAMSIAPDVFPDLAAARRALHASNETAIVLYARLVERVSLD